MGIRKNMRWPGGRYKAVTLSYDDDRYENFILAGIMKKYGLKGTFNINSGRFPEKIDPEKGNYRGCTEEEFLEFIKEYGSIAEIAAHSLTHAALESLSDGEVVYELIEDRKKLEEIVGYPVRGFALPFGTYTPRTLELIKACGLVYCRTIKAPDHKLPIGKITAVPDNFLEWIPTAHSTIPELLDEAKAFIELEYNNRADAKLYYLWGHSYEFERDGNWDKFEKFCETVGGREDIWYATNIEVVDYVEAYKRLIWSVDSKMVVNPGAFSVWVGLMKKLKEPDVIIEIKPGINRLEEYFTD